MPMIIPNQGHELHIPVPAAGSPRCPLLSEPVFPSEVHFPPSLPVDMQFTCLFIKVQLQGHFLQEVFPVC